MAEAKDYKVIGTWKFSKPINFHGRGDDYDESLILGSANVAEIRQVGYGFELFILWDCGEDDKKENYKKLSSSRWLCCDKIVFTIDKEEGVFDDDSGYHCANVDALVKFFVKHGKAV